MGIKNICETCQCGCKDDSCLKIRDAGNVFQEFIRVSLFFKQKYLSIFFCDVCRCRREPYASHRL